MYLWISHIANENHLLASSEMKKVGKRHQWDESERMKLFTPKTSCLQVQILKASSGTNPFSILLSVISSFVHCHRNLAFTSPEDKEKNAQPAKIQVNARAAPLIKERKSQKKSKNLQDQHSTELFLLFRCHHGLSFCPIERQSR